MTKRNNILRIGIFAGAITLFWGLTGASSAFAQNPIQLILDRMDGNYKTLSSLKSDVTMVKFNSQIGSRDTYVGSTSYLPKTPKRVMYVRVDWVKPAVENMVVIDDKYQLYRPNLQQAIKGSTSTAKGGPAAGGALTFLSMSKEQLKANYTLRYVGVEEINGGISTWRVQLTPKAAANYKTADLWVDQNGMPQQAMITEKNDDTTTVLLKNIKKNVVIDASAFSLVLPKGTKIIQG